jgi:hypothetical protein
MRIQCGLGFAKAIFWGKDFAKPRLLIFEIRREFRIWVSARRRGLGRNARFQKYKCKRIQTLSLSFLFIIVRPSLKGMHPRHPPRAFPLWLLAPRCLCAGKLITRASWGEEVSSPRVGRYTPRVLGVRPRHPHSTLCIFMFVVSLSLLDFMRLR